MNEYTLYKYLEFLIFSLYLIMIYLSVQICVIWKNIEKNKLESKIFINESFLKNNLIIIFLGSIFFILHEFIEGINLRNSFLYFEFFELMGFTSIVLFIFKWHSKLKTYVLRQPANEIFIGARMGNKKFDETLKLRNMNQTSKVIFGFIFFFMLLNIALFVPISSIFFILIVGLLFGPPTIALVSTIIVASIISKEINSGHTS